MVVEVRNRLITDISDEDNYGTPFFDEGPGYRVVKVERKSGWKGKLPGRWGELETTRVGNDGLSLADAKELAASQDKLYPGHWVVTESPHTG